MQRRNIAKRRSTAPARWALCAALVIGGCTPAPLLDRAIRARGGALNGVVTTTEDTVYAGAPGTWQCARAFMPPDRFAWKIVTTGDPIYHLFDGATVRCFVGTAEVASDTSACAPLRTQARWAAVANLDALRTPGITLAPLPAADLPPGVREGLRATLADGTTYRLGFDAQTLLVWAQGPLDLSPFGKGEITAQFSDHRRTGGLLLPYSTTYALGATRFADERIVAACVAPPKLTPASFTDPTKLPDCH
jgi:hypothetical protein